MKRLMVFVFIALFSFTLAGCDLIPEDVVERASEEICREDPDNPVCDIESIEDLGDQAVLQLFKEVKTLYENDELNARCETLFSATKVDLLDRCRSQEETMFPVDIENFDVEDITQTNDGYDITIIDTASNMRYVFTLTIGEALDEASDNEEGNYQITAWSYEELITEYAGLSEVLITAAVRDFLSDFSNPDISDDQVCALWVDSDEKCSDGKLATARTKFKAGAELSKTVSIQDPDFIDDDSDGDGLDDGVLDLTVGYEIRGHITVLKLSVQVLMIEEEVVMKIQEVNVETLLEEETNKQLDAFIKDLKNEDILPGEVCRTWLEGTSDLCPEAITEARSKFKAGAELSKTVNINDPDFHDEDSDGDGLLDVELGLSLDGHVTVLKLSFKEIIEEDMRTIVLTNIELIQDGGGDCDDDDCPVFPGQAQDFYLDYLNTYNDPNATREEIDAFFTEPLSEEEHLERERFLSLGIKLVFVDVIGPIDTNTYILVYDIITPDGGYRKDEIIMISRRDDQTTPLLYQGLVIDPDDDGDGISTGDEVAFIEDFKNALNSDVLTPDEVCVMFFGQADTSCPITEEGYVVANIEYIKTSDGIIVRIRQHPEELSSDQQEIIDTYHLYIYHNEEDKLVLDLVPTAFFSYEEEIKEQFQVLIDRVIDEQYTTEEVCALVSKDSQTVCADMRELFMGNNPNIIGVKTVFIEGIEHVKVVVEYSEGDQIHTQTYQVALELEEVTYRQVQYVEASD